MCRNRLPLLAAILLSLWLGHLVRGNVPDHKGDLAVVPGVAVRHLGADANGWSVAETANFRIYHHSSPADAERVARVAEQVRVAVRRKWLGQDGGNWEKKCGLYLHTTGRDYARVTGAPADSPGRSSFHLEGARLISRRIDLRCDVPDRLNAVLPHEVTHAVLIELCTMERLLPRWADEGVAVLSEPRVKIDAQLRTLATLRREGKLFATGRLVQMAEFPEAERLSAFYAQSVSLVDFLAQEKGPRAFAGFLRDVMRVGGEAALKRHYGWGVDELEQRWQRHAFGKGNNARAGVGAR